MRAIAYDAASIGLSLASLLFFYRAVEFLAEKDYVAALLAIGIGFLVVRGGMELGRLAMFNRKDQRSE